jgi:hypothetical protein
MSSSERVLRIHFPTRRYVLSASRAEAGSLELFAPTHHKLLLSTPVRLVIDFGDTPHRFELVGRVSFLRSGAYGVTPEPGIGVSFEGEHKRWAAEMLAFCAGKPLDQGTAARRRVPTQIRCRVVAGPERVSGRVLDLSASGLFVSAPKAPAIKVGSNLLLHFNPGLFGIGGKRLEVRVLWQGEKGGFFGFGGRFTQDARQVGVTLKRYLGAS